MQPYNADLFLDREAEIGLVEGRAKQLLAGASGISRVIAFHGERMSGKTWLAVHLKREILDKPGIPTLLLNLDYSYKSKDKADREGEWYTTDKKMDLRAIDANRAPEIAEDMVRWVAGRVEATAPQGAELKDLARYLTRDVENKYRNSLFVLILDSLFEADWNLLELLEEYLLDPLARLSCVLIVMTGRGRIYPWKSAYLGGELETLKPLEPEPATELFKRANEGSPYTLQEAIELSHGSAGLITLLGGKGTKKKILEKAACELLNVIPKKSQRQSWEYFEALCVLDGFREEMFPAMFAAYDPSYLNLRGEQIDAARRLMVDTHLVRWDEGRFVIDGSVRSIFRALLKEANPDLWRRLHEAARDLYLDWAKKYRRQEHYFQGLASEHQNILQGAEVGHNPTASDPKDSPVSEAITEVAPA